MNTETDRPAESTDRSGYVTVSRVALARIVYVLAAVGIALGTRAIIVSLDQLPTWFPFLALGMVGTTLAVVTWSVLTTRRNVAASRLQLAQR